MQTPNGIGERFSPYKRFRRVSVIPNTLMRYQGLSHGAKLVWARLAQYAGADGRAYPAVGTLAQEVGLKKRQLQNLLAELKTKGFIESEPGSRANTYYFLLHPALIEKGGQDNASRDAESCPSPMQNNAPKETKEEKQRKETTTPKGSRRVSFSDLSEEEQKYIELKTSLQLKRGRIDFSAAAYKAGLVRLAKLGMLDVSGLKELKEGGGGMSPRIQTTQEVGVVTNERIRQYLWADGRSPQEICKILQDGSGTLHKRGFWGLPYQEVVSRMRTLFPSFWAEMA
jgi:hypothetical protein